ncbi:MAG: acireductone dioxygenase [Proteobacteria bacterium]|nr:acireductone dioxygenase [Pseudomonadota bacterium]
MSRLRVFAATGGQPPLQTLDRHADIATALRALGARFERWDASRPIEPGASQDEVIAAYRDDIERIKREGGYQAVDVVSIHPDHPDRAALRAKFLGEHTHAEDEVRFFVAGRGLFNLHIGDKVYELLCERGDLVGVPGGVQHWFDMSEAPYFVAIRIFTNPAGWVGHFTGSDIAERFPRLRPAASQAATTA